MLTAEDARSSSKTAPAKVVRMILGSFSERDLHGMQHLSADTSGGAPQPLRAAVAVPTYNRGAVLLETLDQVLTQDPLPDEILVIDQSDWYPAGVEDALKRLADKSAIRYFRQEMANLPAARNRALWETTCDVVIFIDDDVMLYDHGFVENHRRNYADCPEVVAVAGRVSQKRAWPKIQRPRRWPRVLDYRYLDLDSPERRTGVCTFLGCNHSVRVAPVLALGAYDASFAGVALREETDLALRLCSAGNLIVYEPKAHLLHLAVPSGGCRKTAIGDISGAESVLTFAAKHARELKCHVLSDVWSAFRVGVLNKETLRHPLQLPRLCAKFLVAAASKARYLLLAR
jgi:glycosyltransferase involved in cell wall biosynthesis